MSKYDFEPYIHNPKIRVIKEKHLTHTGISTIFLPQVKGLLFWKYIYTGGNGLTLSREIASEFSTYEAAVSHINNFLQLKGSKSKSIMRIYKQSMV